MAAVNGRASAPPTNPPAAAGLERIPIMLDRSRYLLMDFNAMAMLEAATGQNILMDGGYLSTWSATTLRVALWAGLLDDDPSLAEQAPDGSYPGILAVGKLITLPRTHEVMEALTRAWGLALPTPEAGAEEADPNGPAPVETPPAP